MSFHPAHTGRLRLIISLIFSLIIHTLIGLPLPRQNPPSLTNAPLTIRFTAHPVAAQERPRHALPGLSLPRSQIPPAANQPDPELGTSTTTPLPQERVVHGPVFQPPGRLTRKPEAQADFDQQILNDLPETLTGSITVTLWLDSNGTVLRATHEGGSLPPDIGQIVAQGFIAMPFSPGEIEGQPVATWLTLEVLIE
ncbi:MAG: hypothetical protein PHT48_02270 [Dechloromonas sp.]|nr:hypothetical protein [Dechloromonas sp.]